MVVVDEGIVMKVTTRASSTGRTSLDLSRPNRLGYVVLSLSRSLPAVLPSFSVVAVTSKMSSTT